MGLLERTLIASHIAKRNEGLAKLFRLRYDPNHNGIAQLEESQHYPQAPPYLFGITVPPTAPNISRLEKSRDRLVSGAAAGVQAVTATFGVPECQVVENLTAIDQQGRTVHSIAKDS